MRLTSKVFDHLHLDRSYSLLTVKNCNFLYEYFKMLDIHNNCEMDDVQFRHWMKSVTNLEDKKIDLVYDMLDYDNSGFIEFPEFYLIVCILLALNENSVKRFIYRHSKIVFELMDADGGGTISADEFARYGFLFSLEEQSVQDIFFEFDVSGDENLDYKEFKMFAMACIDKQKDLEQRRILKMKQQEEHVRKMQNHWFWKYFYGRPEEDDSNQNGHIIIQTSQ